jgi:chorismate mutase/prephenate dehydrogenase
MILKDLTEIRKELDKLDNSILELLSKRMALIPSVAEYKKQNNLPRYQPQREKEIIENRRKLAKELNINPNLAENIARAIIEDAHRIEKEIMGK